MNVYCLSRLYINYEMLCLYLYKWWKQLESLHHIKHIWTELIFVRVKTKLMLCLKKNLLFDIYHLSRSSLSIAQCSQVRHNSRFNCEKWPLLFNCLKKTHLKTNFSFHLFLSRYLPSRLKMWTGVSESKLMIYRLENVKLSCELYPGYISITGVIFRIPLL